MTAGEQQQQQQQQQQEQQLQMVRAKAGLLPGLEERQGLTCFEARHGDLTYQAQITEADRTPSDLEELAQQVEALPPGYVEDFEGARAENKAAGVARLPSDLLELAQQIEDDAALLTQTPSDLLDLAQQIEDLEESDNLGLDLKSTLS